MRRFTFFTVFVVIINLLLVCNSYSQVNKQSLNNSIHLYDNQFLIEKGSSFDIDDQIGPNDPRELLPNQQAKFKAIENGAVKSEGKTLSGSDWITTYRQITTYENNLLIKKGYQNFDGAGNLSWYYSATNFYDSNNRIIKVNEYSNNRISYNNYNSNGKLVEILIQLYDGSNYIRTQYTYDLNGYLIESMIQNWDGVQWVNNSKSVYTNDTNGLLIERIRLSWSGTSWNNSSKTSYTNNLSGYPLVTVTQYWQSTQWVNSSKYNYQRTSSNLISESILSYWNSFSSTWILYSKYIYSFTSNEEPFLTLGYNWSGSSWDENYREDFVVVSNSSIMVLLPTNRQQYNYGFSIHWLAVGTNSVDIQFSSNSGNNWTTIAANLPDTGNYDLTYSLGSVNYINSCKVRVRSSSNPSVNDDSYGLFSVTNEIIPNSTQYYFDVNKLKLPIDNKGVIADVSISPYGEGGKFDDVVFLFSGGFFLSGLTNSDLWANGVLSASMVNDYEPGQVGAYHPPDISIGSSNNIPFGPVWNLWSDAVQIGASFYDGNNDGIYNPIDLNGNGIWDPNEDRPDFISDRTAWCVYNDGVPSNQRRYTDVSPQGIEMQQTLFASGTQNSFANNIVFIRYRLTNKGTVSNKFDSVYFSLALDADLGSSGDDLVGCDSLLSSGYTYQKTSDGLYGSNPPAFLVKLLQGPYSYIPGVTFIDNNWNQTYDEGIDTPLDTAYQKNGPYISTKILPGAMNLPLTSFTQYMQSHPTHGDPSTKNELRNYMLGGRGKSGISLNVCTWSFGNGSQLPNCTQVNPMFMYSGDPVTNDGWLNITPIDQRMMLNSGPFSLDVNKPVDIVAAYVVGRGNSPINSVLIAKQISSSAQMYYDMNFTNLPSSIRYDGIDNNLSFNLSQNYPNPFNPSTNIQYAISNPANGTGRQFVTLKVYDVLGREVAMLVNEEKEPGIYRAEFNTQDYQLASGIYLYRIQVYPAEGGTGTYVETRKMILMK